MTDIEKLFADINSAIDDRLTEVAVITTLSKSVDPLARGVLTTLRSSTAQNGALLKACTSALASKKSMAELVHDVEVVARSSWGIQAFGLDLGAIVPPGTGGVIQTGMAQAIFGPVNACHPIAVGEIGLEVPLSLDPSQSLTFAAWINLTVHHEHGNAYVFAVRPASEAMTCPEDFLNGSQHSMFRKQFATQTDLEREFTVPSFELGVIPSPEFLLAVVDQGDGSLQNSGLRFFGQTARRKRNRRTFLPLSAMPIWADFAFRLDLNVMITFLAGRLGQYGARLVAGPVFPSAQSLRVTARIEAEASTHIACVEVGVHVWADVDLIATVKTNSINSFWFEVKQDGPPRNDSDVNPDIPGVDWLLEQLVNYIGGKLANLLPAIDINSNYVSLPDSAKLDAGLSPDGITLFSKQK